VEQLDVRNSGKASTSAAVVLATLIVVVGVYIRSSFLQSQHMNTISTAVKLPTVLVFDDENVSKLCT